VARSADIGFMILWALLVVWFGVATARMLRAARADRKRGGGWHGSWRRRRDRMNREFPPYGGPRRGPFR
jgi:hypothetical protein